MSILHNPPCALCTSEQVHRDRARTYIGINGKEVYYRTQNKEALRKKQGTFGCGQEGWTCSSCARLEAACVCNDATPSTSAGGG